MYGKLNKKNLRWLMVETLLPYKSIIESIQVSSGPKHINRVAKPCSMQKNF